jgi:hypothetical protein
MTRLAMSGLLLVAACAPMFGNPGPEPSMQGELATALEQADREALAGHFGTADRVLADFAARHASTPAWYEASLWRALYKLDPTNQTGTPREAAALLDSYLASSAAPHRGAATTLRRLASTLDRPTTTVSASNAGAPSTGAAKPDDEIARLKDELAKANAELERIKKRLSQPNP